MAPRTCSRVSSSTGDNSDNPIELKVAGHLPPFTPWKPDNQRVAQANTPEIRSPRTPSGAVPLTPVTEPVLSFSQRSRADSENDQSEVVIESCRWEGNGRQSKKISYSNMSAPSQNKQSWIEEITSDLKKVVFRDGRWTNGLEFLQKQNDWGPEKAKEVLLKGAKTFGLWKLSTRELQGLIDRLMDAPSAPTPALQTWIDQHSNLQSMDSEKHRSLQREFFSSTNGAPSTNTSTDSLFRVPERPQTGCLSSERSDQPWRSSQSETKLSVDPSQHSSGPVPSQDLVYMESRTLPMVVLSQEDAKRVLTERKLKRDVSKVSLFSLRSARGGFGLHRYAMSAYKSDLLKKIEVAIHVLVLMVSVLYAIKVVVEMYPEAIEMFGWPVFFARMGGMAAACWTGVLYMTMSRGLLTRISTKLPHTNLFTTFCDGQKDLHVMAGWSLVFTSIEHTLAHFIGTIPGILKADLNSLNDLLGCANADDTPGYLNLPLKFLHWPKCPLEDLPDTFDEALLFTMPGLSGVCLVLLLGAVAYTGREVGRGSHFDRFWYLHNFLIFVWPILLFVHGSNGWIGVGFPLVVFTSSLPFLAYLFDRIMRNLRYFLFAGKAVKILGASCRLGKTGTLDGCLTYLRIRPPPYFWSFQPGMYAFINLPDYAPLQWHPFTICSGADDRTVRFLIAGVGDWTKELARRCTEAERGRKEFPKVCIDGPFSSPSQSALSKELIVAVGAGVGITPFLSLMSTIISVLSQTSTKRKHIPLKEAHFFWMTRSIDEFMFGRDLFSVIVGDPRLRAKIFLHLHNTAVGQETNPHSYLFREAVRQQSKLDHKFFSKIYTESAKSKGGQMITGSQLPWCWAHGSKLDVIWVRQLVKDRERKFQEENSFPDNHWCQNMLLETETATSSRDNRITPLPSLKPPSRQITGGSVETTGSMASLEASAVIEEHADVMIPIVFGRPDFLTEIRNIGKARPQC